MPLVAAAGAFLGTAAGAATVSAGIGAVGSIYASNQANSANKKAVAAQQQATNQQLQLQQQQYDQTRQDYAPYRGAGYAGIDALLSRFGVQSVGTSNAPTAGSPDWQAYLDANPDVAQYGAGHLSDYGDVNGDGQTDLTDFAQGHYSRFGQTEGRTLPTVQAQAADATAPQTAEQQLQAQIGPEPTFAPRETYNRPDFQQPDVGLDKFQASPDYNFRLQEGSRNLNAFNAAKGVLGSGAAMKSLVDYGQNTAAAEYGNWRNYVTGQTDKQNAFNQDSFQSDRGYNTDIYNTDRANTLNRYDTNRAYDTGRSDTQTQNLFNLANLGMGANAQTTGAGSSYANNTGNILQNNANVVSNAFSQTANNNAGLAGSLTGLGQSIVNAFGSKSGTKTATSGGWGSGYSLPSSGTYQWGII
jgi:hypothetical protein